MRFPLLCLFLLACGVPPTSSEYTARNNQAVLTGVPIGSGTRANAEVHKSIELKVTDPYFTVGAAYAGRGPGELAYVMIPVTNTDTRARCEIKTTTYVWRDAAGATVLDATPLPIRGSVGNTSFGTMPRLSATCLGPGETGWLIDDRGRAATSPVYSALASIELSFESTEANGSSEAELIPNAYALDGEQLRVTFKNEGTGWASMLLSGSKYVLLDDDDTPLRWGFVGNNVQPGIKFAPGATGTVDDATDALKTFEGRSTRMRVLMSWSHEATPGS